MSLIGGIRKVNIVLIGVRLSCSVFGISHYCPVRDGFPIKSKGAVCWSTVFYRLFIIHYQATWCHFPESDILCSHHYQNLTSHNRLVQQIILRNSFDTGSADRAVGTGMHSICALQ
jgi:hypothetical protein